MKLRRVIVGISCVALICAGLIIWHVLRAQLDRWHVAKQAAAYRIRAEQGDAESQLWLGSMYYYGKGVPQNFVDSARWFRRSAEQGNPKAEYSLSDMYRGGKGVPQDYAEAARWCRKAAEQGDSMAQDGLGFMYYHGEGAPRDFAEAARWYSKSAEQGYAKAQYDLGYMYYYGYGVPQDRGEANRLFHQAAAQGNEDAEKTIGFNRVHPPATSKIIFVLKCLASLFFAIAFLIPGRGRQARVQIATGVTAVLLLISVALDLFWYFRVGLVQSSTILTVLYLARHLLNGASIAMLVSIMYPKSARSLLITAAALFAFIVLEVGYAQLRDVPFRIWLVCFVGLPIGMSIPAAIFLWLDRKGKGDDGKGDAAIVPVTAKQSL
jgi:predicted alpha/beta-hydrolase family hydrolase